MWDRLPRDVKRELEDPKYKTRTHGSRATSAAKCHGPLCRKAERDRTNKKHRDKQQEKGLEVVPRPRTEKQLHHEKLLEEIIDWHRAERGLEPLYGNTIQHEEGPFV